MAGVLVLARVLESGRCRRAAGAGARLVAGERLVLASGWCWRAAGAGERQLAVSERQLMVSERQLVVSERQLAKSAWLLSNVCLAVDQCDCWRRLLCTSRPVGKLKLELE